MNNKKLQSICADYSEAKTHVFDIHGDSGYDCHNTCVVWNHITFYGVPFDLMDERMERIYQGDYHDAVKIGELWGCLLLCRQLLDDGEDPLAVCADIDADLGYAISALSDEEDGPLSLDNGDPCLDVYYIRELMMEAGYDDTLLKSRIIAELPGLILTFCHVAPDILAFYPAPPERSEEEPRPVPGLSIVYDPIFGQQVKADKNGEGEVSGLPLSARPEGGYELYEMNGFREVTDTGVFFKYVAGQG
ncbi:MAG: hypothetical protein ACM3PE_09495 [Deltaproteobacteria bacterium]